jgi:RND family efflux transporter, MFP subunit
MVRNSWNILSAKGLFLLALLAALSLTACDEQAQQERPLATVTYLEIVPEKLTLTTELSGRTSAFMVSEVRPQVGGIIQKRLFTEGTDVQQGDVLYQIDPSLFQAAYDNALAALQRAEANVKSAILLAQRYEKVVKLRAVSKQEYDDAVAGQGRAEAEVAAARAALDSARINLEYTKVTAPVSGRIGRSTVTPGALVTQNQPNPLGTIQQLDPIYVDVTQSSMELLRLKKAYASGALTSSGEGAMRATLKLEDGSAYTTKVARKDPATGRTLKDANGKDIVEEVPVIGSLKFSEVAVEQSTGVITIRAVFPNPDGILLPGMYVRAILEEGVDENAIRIPQKTVVRNTKGLPVVQVLQKQEGGDGGKERYLPEARVIAVDRAVGHEWLVREGLKAGERIVLVGLQSIATNTPVYAEPENAGDKAKAGASEVSGNTPGASGGKSR